MDHSFSFESSSATTSPETPKFPKNQLLRESVLEEDIADILDDYAGSVTPRCSMNTVKRARRQSSVYQDTISMVSQEDVDAFLKSSVSPEITDKRRKLVSISLDADMRRILEAGERTRLSRSNSMASPDSARFSVNTHMRSSLVVAPAITGFSNVYKDRISGYKDRSSVYTHLVTNGLRPTESSRHAIGSDFYGLSADDHLGNTFQFSELRDKVVLVVNVSFYGKLATRNFRFLNELYAKYKSQGLVIIGFPCTQFTTRKSGSFGPPEQGLHKRSVSLLDLNTIMEQQRLPLAHLRSQSNNSTMLLNHAVTNALATESSIEEMIVKHDIQFPVFGEVKVNGKQTSTIYNFLKNDKKGVFGTKFIKWNFEKFIVDRYGNVNKRFSCLKNSRQIEQAVCELLEDESNVLIDKCQPIIGFNEGMFT